MTLAEFLLARIAEDEQRVYDADSDGEYRIAWATFRQPDGLMGHAALALDHNDGAWVTEAQAVREMKTEPIIGEPVFEAARVLAECEAKRRIVDLADDATWVDEQVDNEFRVGSRDLVAEPYVGDLILRALALPYADHPDFDPAWRPDDPA